MATSSSTPASRGRGFTLVELIATLILVSVLSVVALPRILDTGDWQLRAYSDQLQSAVMLSHRMALAQRRTVVAVFAASGAALYYDSAGGTPLALPGASSTQLNCPVKFPNCLSTGSVSFNQVTAGARTGRTQTSTGAALTVTVSGGGTNHSFAVENDTGHVHRL